MTIVVIDSNAVHRDPWMRNAPGQELLARASRGECRAVFPRVVLDELLRQQHDWVKEHREAVRNVLDEMRGNPIDVSDTAKGLSGSFDVLREQVDRSFEALESHPGVEVAPIPVAPDLTARILERDLARRRPFLEVGSEAWSAGYRDVVIWETVLECLGWLDDDEKLIFVTADNGFLTDDNRSLHPHLIEDLDARGFPHDRVISAKTTFLANEEIQALFAKETERRELVAIATDELFSLDGREISMEMVHGGDYDYPEFVRFQVPFESAMIVAIDQNTAFEFQETGMNGTITGLADVTLAIDGAMTATDWWADEYPTFDVEEVLNRHMLGVSTSIDVRAIVEIDTTDGPGKYRVTSILLEDVPPEPNITIDLSALGSGPNVDGADDSEDSRTFIEDEPDHSV